MTPRTTGATEGETRSGSGRSAGRRGVIKRAGITALEQAPSVEDRIIARLVELIVSGELPAGTPLRHRDLAKEFNVSPTPVRAGLSQLERDGLVVMGRAGRAEVSPLTHEDLEEIYAARRGLEGLAARRGAPAISDEDLARMAELLDEIRALATSATLAQYLDARWRFHAVCYRATGRERLVAEVERLFWRAVRYHRLLLSTPDSFPPSVHYYERFFDACEQRDGEMAEAVIVESLRWAVDRLARVLKSEVRPGASVESSDGARG